MASGSSITIDVTSCDSAPGIVGVGPVTTTPGHGSASITNGSTDTINYVNNGDGATTDSFIFSDSNGTPITVTVAIGAATSPITVTPASLPTPNVGTAYSVSLSASGGTAPYTYSLASGSPPTGLTVSGNVISGTPTAAGTYTFTMHVVDNASVATNKSYSVTVPVPTISLSALPNPVQGAPYNQALSSSGGTAPYTYSVDVGPLPPGLSLSSSGVFSGTPTTQGNYSFTIRSTDHSTGGPYFNSRAYSVTVLAPPPLTLSPTSVSNAQVGTAYSATVSASGGTAPYTYSITAGSLPAGMTLNTSTGALSGTPTAGGTFNFTVTAHDVGLSTGSQAYSLVVAAPVIVVSPTTLPAVTQNSAYSQTVTASGGTSTYTYAVTSGSLPAGVTLSSAGVLSGTPTASGTFNFQITATDSSTGTGPYTGSRSYSLTVNALPPVITTTSLAAGMVGTSYSQVIAVSGGNAPLAFAVTSGNLPAGLSLSSSGVLTGTPTAGGTFAFSITVTDSLSTTSTQSYSLTINPPTVVASPSTLPVATLHAAYNQTVNGSGGTAPYTFSVTSGALPPGVSLSSSGALSGHPTTSGTYSFVITATDSSTGSGPYTGSQSYSVTVSAPTITLSPSGSVPVGTVGVAYSQTITAGGGSGPYTYAVTAGTLPAGLTLSSAGVVSGTPTAGGNFSFTVTATDANTNTGSQSYTLTTNAPTIIVSPSTVPAPIDGVAYSQSLTGNGGTAPYTFSVTAGAPPPGINLASNGTLSGTPTGVGTYSFTVQALDSSTGSGPYTGTQSYTVTIANPTPVLAPAGTTLSGNYAQAYSQTFTASGGASPYTYAESGTLPAGVTWNAATATLSGTPTQSGNFPITITATDHSTGSGAPFIATGNYTLTIAAPTITITPSSTLLSGAVGQVFNQALTASGGIASYTFTVISGSLPTGVSLSSAGVISGVPTAAGTFNFTVRATDAHGATGTQSYSLFTSSAVVVLVPASLPGAVAESNYSQFMLGSGGTAPYTFAISAGTLPPGLSLNATTGALLGTPTAPGNYNFTIRATDSSTGTGAPFFATQNYTVTVSAPTITLSPATLNPPQLGVAFNQQITASGGNGSYTYAVSAGSLPAGMTLSSGGLLAGTPTAASTFGFTITATDGSSFTGTQAYSGTISPPSVVVNPATLPAATAESAYAQAVTASGGTAPYTYAISAGSLPAGLSLNTSTGALSGTPTVAGTFNITIRATDSSSGTGAPFSATHNYALTVNAPSITLSPGTLSAGQVGVALSQQLTASGGNGSYAFNVSGGALPPGVSLSPSGLLSGTPTGGGTFNITITAQDGLHFTGSQAYSLTVNGPALALSPGSLPAGTAETAYAQTFSSTGGTAPYHYAISAGALPAGLSLNASTGVLSGTPTAAGSFSVTVSSTDSSTGAGAPYSVAHSYALNIAGPNITVSPATLAAGRVGTSYSQAFSASGGSGGYTYAVSAGSLPGGLSLASNGALTGTPTVAGSLTFSIAAKDGLGFTGSQSLTLSVNQPVPVAVNDTATTPANSPVSIAVTANDSGPITSVAVTQAPTHGSASINGLSVVYTPANNFFGTDTLMYDAMGPGGTSAPASVSITVTPLAMPVALSQTATVLAGKPVTIHATNGATGGPFTAVMVTTPPGTGTATVSGMDIVYTPPANASGPVSFGYSVANAFGQSAPANVTIAVNPLPVPSASLITQAVAGTTLQVDLTGGAVGGPFTAANLVSITPAQAANASIRSTGNGYALDITLAANFSGAAQLAFTLSNAYATSAPAILTIQVAPRSDPSKDAEVLGILDAQADATRRLALGQINNFQRRLESLHGGNVTSGFTNGISVVSGGGRNNRDPLTGLMRNGNNEDDWSRRYLVQQDAPANAQAGGTAGGGGLPGDVSIWTGGAANFGTRELGGSSNGIDFTTSGLSVGADKQITESLAAGAGVGYGHDASDIGHHGSRSTVDSYNVAGYASYRPAASIYIDALIGYQWLSFDARRYVTDNGGMAYGSRDGTQVFGSFSLGYERQQDSWALSPYARLDLAHARLDAYTEQGGGIYALSYQRQTVDSSTGSLGLRGDFMIKRDYGVWMPRFRIEYQRDFEGGSQATMRYADLLTGPLYSATLNQQARNHTLLGLGVQLQTLRGLMLRLEYQNLLDNSSHDNQSILFGVEQKFQP